MEEINEVINKLISIKDNYGDIISEEIFTNVNYDNIYRDLTENEIKRINKYRKNTFYIYKAIDFLNEIEK